MKRSIVVLTILLMVLTIGQVQAQNTGGVEVLGESLSIYTNNDQYEVVFHPATGKYSIEIFWAIDGWSLENVNLLGMENTTDSSDEKENGYYYIRFISGYESVVRIHADLYNKSKIVYTDGLIFVSNMDKSWYKMCQMDKLVHEIMFGKDENGFPHGFVFDPMLNYPSQPVVIKCDRNGSPPPVPEDKDLNNVPVQCDPNGGPPPVPEDKDLNSP